MLGRRDDPTRDGLLALEKGQPERAREAFGSAAGAGNPEALYRMGLMLRDGVGGEASLEKAVEHFLKAGERGHGRAWLALADLARSKEETEESLTRAAETGWPDCMERYAMHLADTDLANATEARRWMSAAAREGWPSAMRRYGQWMAAGFGGKADPKEGFIWAYAAVVAGDGPEGEVAVLALAQPLSAKQITEGQAAGRRRAALVRRPRRG
jgi:hypothetical protein